MESQHEISVVGTLPLSCSLAALKQDVFARIGGFGDVCGSGSGSSGWRLDLAFDSASCFTGIIDAVRQSLTELDHDLFSVTVSVRGRRHQLVELL